MNAVSGLIQHVNRVSPGMGWVLPTLPMPENDSVSIGIKGGQVL